MSRHTAVTRRPARGAARTTLLCVWVCGLAFLVVSWVWPQLEPIWKLLARQPLESGFRKTGLTKGQTCCPRMTLLLLLRHE